MANIAQLLAAIANLPQIQGGPPLTPTTFPTDIQAPESARFSMPEPPPMAPSAPLDRNIIEQYLSLLGAAPAAPPPPAQVGTLGKIGLALQGFGAGFQGQGPQFVQALRAERERPQREYEARLDDYNARRQRLGERGLEAARDVEEKRQSRQTALADRQYEREFQQFIRRNNITDQVAIEKMREARDITRLREQERIADERQQVALKAQQERNASMISKQFASPQGGGAPPEIAQALGKYYADIIDELPAAAARWDAGRLRLNEIQARKRAAGGGGGRGGGGSSNTKVTKFLQQFNEAKDAVKDAILRGDPGAEQLARKRMGTTLTMLSRFPAQVQIEVGEGNELPSAKVKTATPARKPMALTHYDRRIMAGQAQGPIVGDESVQPQAQAPMGKTATMAQVRASAKKARISEQEAAQQFRDAGYTIIQ